MYFQAFGVTVTVNYWHSVTNYVFNSLYKVTVTTLLTACGDICSEVYL